MDNKSILTIKNMVCPRCIKVVREELENLGYTVNNIKLGEVELSEKESEIDLKMIKERLQKEGFELIEDSKGKLVDTVKTEIINVIQKYKHEDLEKIVFSKYLSEQLGKDYFTLSSLFSKMEGITIEHFVILQKIEKAKELLRYGEMTLSEIAYELGYTSVQHLSNQFKKVTGMTASQFKKDSTNLRNPIDSVGN
ncbi:Transcriptional regulator, AraC family [hydrothermal vent metagenome]|uniref:Transcriptional regulator, AraC family n=1 Tax=hydrothermal vent metagenome TaxID=652676 RepID=A0A3B1CSC9_9ZZZZ